MTPEEFEQKLTEIDEEGNRLIAAAKQQAEASTNLQGEIAQGITMLKAHYAQKIEALINAFVSQSTD